jgi:Tfp pilus tip-associated adhesin PilY1
MLHALEFADKLTELLAVVPAVAFSPLASVINP